MPATALGGSTRLIVCAGIVLTPVAAIGAVLSFRSLYAAAVPVFGTYFAVGFPCLVDFLILGASIMYAALPTADASQTGWDPRQGWRITAHAGIGATLALNALAAPTPSQVPWHITAPAVWAVLVELSGRQFIRRKTTTSTSPSTGMLTGVDRKITVQVWLSAPVESFRVRLVMARSKTMDVQAARIAAGVHVAACQAVRVALPGLRARSTRALIRRQLRAGTLTPTGLLTALGWINPPDEGRSAASNAPGKTRGTSGQAAEPALVGREVLITILDGGLDRPAARKQRKQLPHRATSDSSGGTSEELEPERVDSQIVAPQGQLSDGEREGPMRGLPHTATGRQRRASVEKATGPGARRARRQQDADGIVERLPHITGAQLRSELAAKNWAVSDRTALRLLRQARKPTSGVPDQPVLAGA